MEESSKAKAASDLSWSSDDEDVDIALEKALNEPIRRTTSYRSTEQLEAATARLATLLDEIVLKVVDSIEARLRNSLQSVMHDAAVAAAHSTRAALEAEARRLQPVQEDGEGEAAAR